MSAKKKATHSPTFMTMAAVAEMLTGKLIEFKHGTRPVTARPVSAQYLLLPAFGKVIGRSGGKYLVVQLRGKTETVTVSFDRLVSFRSPDGKWMPFDYARVPCPFTRDVSYGKFLNGLEVKLKGRPGGKKVYQARVACAALYNGKLQLETTDKDGRGPGQCSTSQVTHYRTRPSNVWRPLRPPEEVKALLTTVSVPPQLKAWPPDMRTAPKPPFPRVPEDIRTPMQALAFAFPYFVQCQDHVEVYALCMALKPGGPNDLVTSFAVCAMPDHTHKPVVFMSHSSKSRLTYGWRRRVKESSTLAVWAYRE